MFWQLVLLIVKIKFISALNVSLSVKPSSAFSDSLVTLQCTLFTKNPSIEHITLNFPNNIKFYYDGTNIIAPSISSKAIVPTYGWHNVSKSEQRSFPFLKSIYVNKTFMSVKIMPTPNFNGNVNCSAKTKYSLEYGYGGGEVSETALLDVSWTSAVLNISWSPAPLQSGSKGTVSCTFRVSSKLQQKPMHSGFDEWSLTTTSDSLNGHATKEVYEFTKDLIPGDNGSRVDCSIGGSSENAILDVHYPPKLRLLPDEKSVFVGTTIFCEAKANPTVKAELVLSMSKNVNVSADNAVNYTVPMTTASGEYKASCKAGSYSEIATFQVKKLPLEVTLAIGEEPLKLGTPRRIVCSSPDPVLQFLEIRFQYRDLIISNNFSDGALLVKSDHNAAPHVVDSVSETFFNVTVETWPKNNKLEVILNPTTFYDETTVVCVAKSAPNVGKEGRSQNKTLSVHWDPTVQSMTIVNSSNGTEISENQKIAVRCKVRDGNPKTTPEALIGHRRLRNPSNQRAIDYSAAMELYEVSWHAQVSREDDKNEVICRFDEKIFRKKQLRVRFSPRLNDIAIHPQKAEVLSGDRLTCTAKGFPSPLVTLRVEPSPLQSWKVAYGSATLTVTGREAGNVTFVCDAGGFKQKVVKIVAVQKRRKESEIPLIHVISPIVVLLIVMPIIFYFCYRRRHDISCRSNSPKLGDCRINMSFTRRNVNEQTTAVEISTLKSHSEEAKAFTSSTSNDDSNTCLISDSEREAELTYAVLDFDDVPTSSPNVAHNSVTASLPQEKKRESLSNGRNKEDDEDVVYSELAPCQDISANKHVCVSDNDNDYEEVMCTLP